MMWGYYYNSWNALWMAGTMLLFLAVVITLVVWGIRAYSGTGDTGREPLETLRRRLAAGEISGEEFERTKRHLQD